MKSRTCNGILESNTWCGSMCCWANDCSFAAELKDGRTFEQDIVQNLLRNIVMNSTCIIDVGAHVGMHTLGYIHLNKNVIVHAFEPQTRMFELLQRNVGNSTASNRIHMYNLAVGHRKGSIEMSPSVEDGPNSNCPIQYGTNDTYNMGGLAIGKGGEKAEMIDLDSLGLQCCDFIKIDVEGFEPLVILGAKQLIQTYHPVIMFESNDKHITKDAYSTLGDLDSMPILDTFKILESMGYHKIDQISHDNFLAHYGN